MPHFEELHNIKKKIGALRILFICALVLMFISVCQGHNSIGLLFLGVAIVLLCMLSHIHSDRIYYESLHSPEL